MMRRSGKGILVAVGGFVVIFLFLLTSPHDARESSDLGRGSPNTSDIYDPNDNFYDATYVYGGWYDNLDIGGSDDYDYYQVYVNSNYRLIVNINWSTSGDLDLFIYNSNYNQLNSSMSSYNKYENVSYPITSSGYYYIKVQNYGGSIPTYSLFIDTDEYANVFSPRLFLSIFIPIVVIVALIIIVAAAVHNYNKKQKVIRPSTVSHARPWQQAPQPTINYAPQPSSYTPSYAPSYTPPISQQPVVNVAPPKPESKGRFCSSCGAKLEPTQRFCHNCGIDCGMDAK